MSKLRPRLTYANVVSTICLFIVLGGSAFAAATVITGKNVENGSLTGKDVKNSSLTGPDVKNNSLTGADVKNIKSGDVSDGSLLARDFKAGQLPAEGTQGPKGDKGDTGQKGDKGETGDKGDTGDTGGRGPSDAFGTTGPATTLALPAGDYVVSAKTEWDSGGTTPLAGDIQCTLNAGGTPIDSARQSYPAGGFASVALLSQAHLATASSVDFGCTAVGTGTSKNPRLEAIQVGALH
jgi:hypothetical protein